MYGSIADVRIMTGVSVAQVSDATITSYLTVASKIIESLTGRVFYEVSDYVEPVDGNADWFISVSNYPVRVLVEIKVDNVVQTLTNFVFDISGRIREINGNCVFTKGVANILVKYDYGDPDNVILADRTANFLASKMVVGDLARIRGKGLKSERLGEYAFTVATNEAELSMGTGLGETSNELDLLLMCLGKKLPVGSQLWA